MKSKVINLLNNVITHLIYTIYPIVLVLLLFYENPLFLKVLLVPLISFILVSLYRNHVNAPRPYEVNDTEPIISKHSKGRSFPSRHVFSAFVIATTLFFVSKVFRHIFNYSRSGFSDFTCYWWRTLQKRCYCWSTDWNIIWYYWVLFITICSNKTRKAWSLMMTMPSLFYYR